MNTRLVDEACARRIGCVGNLSFKGQRRERRRYCFRPHTVVTLTGNKTKRQKANNCRYGYLTSSMHLLENVQIDFAGGKLRGYSFSYVDGAFSQDNA